MTIKQDPPDHRPQYKSVGSERPDDKRLRENAVTVSGGIAMALGSAGPTASIALSLAALLAVSSFASPLIVLLAVLPMLGIGIAFSRLNRSRAHSGATYEWVGRAISPSLGFMVGWLIVLLYMLCLIAVAVLIGPIAISLVSDTGGSWMAQATVGSIAIIAFTIPAYVGVRAAARAQWVLIAVEYIAMAVLAVLALVAVLNHDPGTVEMSMSWFSWETMGGMTGLVNGALIAVFLYQGWDSAVLISEESTNPTRNPGRAVLVSLVVLALLYSFLVFAFQGALSPQAIQDHGEDALTFMAQSLGGTGLAKFIILSVLLSAIGAGLASVVSGSRIMFAMAADNALPAIFSKTHPEYKTPAIATVGLSAVAIGVVWLYAGGSTGTQSSFEAVVNTIGVIAALYYSATGLASLVFFRTIALTSVRNALQFILAPVASVTCLLFIVYKSIPGLGGWGGNVMLYLYFMIGAGVVLMLYARAKATSGYFYRPREVYSIEDEDPIDSSKIPM